MRSSDVIHQGLSRAAEWAGDLNRLVDTVEDAPCYHLLRSGFSSFSSQKMGGTPIAEPENPWKIHDNPIKMGGPSLFSMINCIF